MREEIQEVYLSLEKGGSITDNRLILVRDLPYGAHRDKKYCVRHFKYQYEAVRKLAVLFSEEDDDFLNRLVEMDKRKSESTPNRRRRVSEDKSILPGHKIHEVEGFYLELKHDKTQQRNLAKTMCEVADVDFSTERHPRI